ncbi:hypothetical protein H5410_047415 [Solanum commersonii]|uniref:At1g61320/AtMIF1 LRR domain-containing protein n=1 Tax=Solanum commersonii TaxID=4109 RepID=A0A9J5XH10_SOLCO|nr:hypothetical protein H5410_047415 [Solanum commersonii]
MADLLPECLIQKILNFLPSYNQASKMSILSKTWLQAWSTLPNLKFSVIDLQGWEGHTKIVDTIMERYGKQKIPIEKFELSESFTDFHHVFSRVDKWLFIALENDCTLMPVSLSNRVVNCNSLRKISLSDVTLDENMLQTLLNSCPLIVSFVLENCPGIKVVKIKLDSLKVLKIDQYCECDIDAPNLVSLDYTGTEIPEFNIARESSQLKNLEIILHCISSLNTAWFCKLRKFLSNSSSWSEVSLKCDEINITDLQMDHIGSTGGVDVLNLSIIECPTTFVDALLWSFHPGRLNLISIDTETVTSFIDHLIYMSHPTSHGWNNQLKEIKDFDGKNQSLQLGSEELAKRITEGEQPYFILDW